MAKQNTFTLYIDKVEYKDDTIGYNASTSCMGPCLLFFNNEKQTRDALIALMLGSHVLNPNLFPLNQEVKFLAEYSQQYQSIGKVRRIGDEMYNTKHFRLVVPMEPDEIRFFAHTLHSIGRIGY